MNKSSVFSSQKSTSFEILHCVFQSNDAWEQRLEWFKTCQEYRNFGRIDSGPMEFEEYFPRIQDVAAQSRSQKFTVEIK